MKIGLKPKLNYETYEYLIKHGLLEKYFNNFSNFNSNNSSLKEGFNTYYTGNNSNKNKLSRSPVYGLDNSFSFNAGKLI